MAAFNVGLIEVRSHGKSVTIATARNASPAIMMTIFAAVLWGTLGLIPIFIIGWKGPSIYFNVLFGALALGSIAMGLRASTLTRSWKLEADPTTLRVREAGRVVEISMKEVERFVAAEIVISSGMQQDRLPIIAAVIAGKEKPLINTLLLGRRSDAELLASCLNATVLGKGTFDAPAVQRKLDSRARLANWVIALMALLIAGSVIAIVITFIRARG